MKLTLLGWTSSGLRCPDAAINLSRKDGSVESHRVTLVQMPNGTGKTTTLALLRAAMTGEARSWSSTAVQRLRRPGAKNEEGTFELRLALDEVRLTLRMKLDFAQGIATYATQYQSQNTPAWSPPASARPFLREDFVKLFVFDGEFADELLDPRKAAASDAICSLFQLQLFQELEEAAQTYLHDKVKDSPVSTHSKDAVKEKEGLLKEAEENALDLKEKSDEVTARLLQLEDEQSGIANELTQLEDKTKHIHDDISKAEREIEQGQNVRDTHSSAMLIALRTPLTLHARFHEQSTNLMASLDRLKLPARTSSQWFDELASDDNDDCVCGRPLGSEERAAIQDHKQRFLGDDVHAVLNPLKSAIQRDLAAQKSQPSAGSTLAQESKNLAATYSDLNQKKTLLSQCRQQLIAHGNSDEQELAKRLGAIDTETKQLRALQTLFAGDDGPKSVAAAQKKADTLRDELLAATQTAEIGHRTQVLKRILKRSRALAEERLKEVIRQRCNDQLQQVLPNDPLRLSSIDKSLTLEGQESGSMGQNLAVGYTFLTVLLSEGSHEFPLIVDSPAGPLDHTVRGRIAQMVPMLCHQFVAYMISTEREGFVPPLEETVGQCSGGSIQFLTLVRRTSGTESRLLAAPESASQTWQSSEDSSVLVEDREFFMKFDLDEV